VQTTHVQSSSHFKMTKERRHESSKRYISVVRAVKVPNVPGADAEGKVGVKAANHGISGSPLSC